MTTPHESRQTETRSHFDYRDDETPVEAVVARVAEATGQSPLEMEPLQKTIDTDALNALLTSPGEEQPSVTVAFDYCGQRVIVTATGIEVSSSPP